MRHVFPGILVLTSLLLSACAQHINRPSATPDIPKTEWTVDRDILFSPDGWPEPLYADLYQPRTAGPHAVVLMVHGGGWTRRSRDDMSATAETLASRGLAVMNIDYRFAPEHRFPAQLHDLQIAMKWLKESGPKHGLNPESIGAFGFSSGGHLVSLLALVAGTDSPLDQPYGGPGTKPKAVVSGGTPTDLRKFGEGVLVEQLLGGTIRDVPNRYRKASPVVHVHSGAPPFFLFHGTWDTLVPVDHARDFKQRLDELGVYNELFLMRGRGHFLSFLTSADAVDQGVRFLRSRLNPGFSIGQTSRKGN